MHCYDSAAIAKAASHVVCIVQAPDWRIYLSPILIAISAFIAYRAILNTRSIARQKATLDFIEKSESTELYRTASDTFSDLRRGEGFSLLHAPQDDETRARRRAVTDYLNHYEFIAIGILEDILDEKIYRAWMEGAFVRDWNAAAEFIQRERWKRRDDGTWYYYPHHFEHYQCVAESWSKEAVPISQVYSGPPAEANGPGADPIPATNPDPDAAQ